MNPPEETVETAGGVAASVAIGRPGLGVAPTLEDGRNTVRRPLAPIGCWRASDLRFEFDSSCPRPELRSELRVLDRRLRAHEACQLTIFGHADPVGQDTYNKQLSGRRAKAIYALLTRRVDLWEELFGDDDSWDQRGIPRMVGVLVPDCAEDEAPASFEDRIKSFQKEHGLVESGDADSATRQKLFESYMDHLCVDAEGQPWSLAADRFLGKGHDDGGKADYQGCSEFNPLRLLSKGELDAFQQSGDKTGRNAANAPNRRVLILLFPGDLVVDPESWPCPAANDGTFGCKKRFWSDGESRRQAGAERREYKDSQDTFACRFYQRIAGVTPCELGVLPPRMTIRMQLHDLAYRPVDEVGYRLILDTGEEIVGTTDCDGWLTERAVAREQQVRVVYRIDGDEEDDAPVPLEVTAFVSPDRTEDDAWTRRNSRNFGFHSIDGGDDDPVLLLQSAHRELDVTGKADDDTKTAIRTMLDEGLTDSLGSTSDG